MKATGIVRPVDELGRIVLPVTLRREIGVERRDGLEIYIDGEDIILQKYRPSCIFCGEHDKLSEVKGKLVCDACLTALMGRSGLVD